MFIVLLTKIGDLKSLTTVLFSFRAIIIDSNHFELKNGVNEKNKVVA